jgi:TatD DNase family protein
VAGWTDSHCHLQDQFRDGLAVDDVVARARSAGVDRLVIIGTDAESSREALALASRNESAVEMFSTAGLHPHDASTGVAQVAAVARAGGDRLVGIGECGLDYYYEHSPRDAQRSAFAAQIGLAHELSLALVVHARDAWDDLFSIFDSEGVPSRTVIHCFTGGPGDAERCLAAGCDLSFSGIATFKNADDVRAAAQLTPLTRMHVETDSPFLAPVPHRGRPNEPAHVAIVGAFLAELLDVDVAALRTATAANSTRLFNLP